MKFPGQAQADGSVGAYGDGCGDAKPSTVKTTTVAMGRTTTAERRAWRPIGQVDRVATLQSCVEAAISERRLPEYRRHVRAAGLVADPMAHDSTGGQPGAANGALCITMRKLKLQAKTVLTYTRARATSRGVLPASAK